MTNQEKKAYLMKYRAADNEINDLLREKEAVMSRLTKVTATISDMPRGGGDSDKVSSGVYKLMELDKEIDAKVDALVDLRKEIIRSISSVDSDTQRRVLKLRYIDGMTWERVACVIGRSVPMTKIKIHMRALEAVEIEEKRNM